MFIIIFVQVFVSSECLEGNTISNRGAYSTKERMPSDMKQPLPLPAWKAVHDWLSRCTAFQAEEGL